MYYVYFILRLIVALLCGAGAAVGLVLYGVPTAVPIAVGWVLLVVLVGAYSASEEVRGRHRVYIFEAVLFGLGTTPFAFFTH
ncbi:MAG TPA: hypothetical protein VJ843_05460 [Candidatus Saccharimonadales bacterium]|nr:hypothetical protein [Candidatus Saccharimonadales bacterium]